MQLPSPVRAVLGLLATAADEAKHLPDRAIELPMLAVSSALQVSLRAQQRYARLAARGDDVLNRRSTGEEPPPWATFDAPVAPNEVQPMWSDPPAGDQRTRAASQLLDQILGMDGLLAADASDPTDPSDPTDRPGAAEPSGSAKAAPKRLAAVPDPAAKGAKKASPKPASGSPAKTASPAAKKKSTAAKSPPKSPASKVPASTTTVATSAAKPRTAKTAKAAQASVKNGAAKKVGKTINKPRHTTPSRFDIVDDD